MIANDAKGTVTFNLTKPDGEWLQQLAVPLASILPAATPPKDQGTKPVPGTGPYMIKSYDPNHQIVLVRNPHFKQWSKDAQPAGYPDHDHASASISRARPRSRRSRTGRPTGSATRSRPTASTRSRPSIRSSSS